MLLQYPGGGVGDNTYYLVKDMIVHYHYLEFLRKNPV